MAEFSNHSRNPSRNHFVRSPSRSSSRALVPANTALKVSSPPESAHARFEEAYALVMHLHDSVGDLMTRQMVDAAHGRGHPTGTYVSAVSSHRRGVVDSPKKVDGSCIVRCAPGDAREWRHQWRDDGEERRSVGHYLGDQGYIKEVWRHKPSNKRHEDRQLYGLQEEDVPQFDREWSRRMQKPTTAKQHMCLAGRESSRMRLADIIKPQTNRRRYQDMMPSLVSRTEALRQDLANSDSLLMVLRSQINQLRLNSDDAALAREMEALNQENKYLCTRVEMLVARLGSLEKKKGLEQVPLPKVGVDGAKEEIDGLPQNQEMSCAGVSETENAKKQQNKPKDKREQKERRKAPETEACESVQIGAALASDRPSLMRFLQQLEITDFTMTEHPEVFTVETMMPYLESIEGAVGKNLFLKDKKKRLYLLAARHDAEVRLNDVAKQIGASGGLRLADETILFENLGVRQGCVNPYALANDTKCNVKFLIDKSLIDGSFERIHFHPMSNAATIGITVEDFKKFLKATNHDPVPIAL